MLPLLKMFIHQNIKFPVHAAPSIFKKLLQERKEEKVQRGKFLLLFSRTFTRYYRFKINTNFEILFSKKLFDSLIFLFQISLFSFLTFPFETRGEKCLQNPRSNPSLPNQSSFPMNPRFPSTALSKHVFLTTNRQDEAASSVGHARAHAHRRAYSRCIGAYTRVGGSTTHRRRCNSGSVGGSVISCFIFILSSAYYEQGCA